MSFRKWALVLMVAAALPVSVGVQTASADRRSAPPLLDWTAAGAATLDQWYDPATGVFQSTGWWNSAHALEAELTASQLDGDSRGIDRAANTFATNQQGGFRDDYYDDEGWWALTWLKAFDITHDARYLRTARSLFADMAASWDQTCGGGVWWSRARDYKNAVTNEIFIELAAQLAERTGDDTYRSWATRGWNWFLGTGMINASQLVNDGLDATCHNNGRTTWTYNQGVILGAAVDLYRLTGSRQYLRVATGIANAAMTALSGPGDILHEPCEPVLSRTIVWSAVLQGCGADAPQFKGIFIWYLTVLAQTAPSPRYVDFVVGNAVSIWNRSRDPRGEFGLIWSGPVDRADAARQSSALACLNSAAELVGPTARPGGPELVSGRSRRVPAAP